MLAADVRTSHFLNRSLHNRGYNVMEGVFCAKEGFWHRHEGWELLVLHSGTADVVTPNWRTRLYPGRAAVIRAGVAHGIYGVFNRTVIHFTPQLLNGSTSYGCLFAGVDDISEGLSLPLSGQAVQRLVWVATQLGDLAKTGIHQLTTQALFNLVAADIHVGLEQDGRTAAGCKGIEEIISYMSDSAHYGESIDTVCERFDMSTTQLWKLFTAGVGCSPGEYWLNIRLEHAGRLLHGDVKIADIAVRVGFTSLRGFQRAFRRRYGMSPSEYRQHGRR